MVLIPKYSDTIKKNSRDENRMRRTWQCDREWQHGHSHITLRISSSIFQSDILNLGTADINSRGKDGG
jgi:hypothetical protein